MTPPILKTRLKSAWQNGIGIKSLFRADFDVTKADKIFGLLLQEGLIKLFPNHTIPSVDELKNRKYCKWHNAVSHNTYECKAFR
jgi:hypothetical protein